MAFCCTDAELLAQQPAQVDEHPTDAGVVELRGDGGIHRHVLVGGLERDAVALPLLADVAQCVFCAALVELVQHHQFGVIQHVDLFELAGRAEVAGHDVHREIDEVDDLRIALADAGGFDNDQVVAQRLQKTDAVLQHQVGGRVLAAGGHRTHEHAFAAQRIHADAVAQQRAAGAATGGVDRHHGDAHLGKIGEEAVQQFIGDRRFAGAAGAGDAHDRCLAAGQLPFLAQMHQLGFVQRTFLNGAEHVADGDFVEVALVGDIDAMRLFHRLARGAGAAHHVLDHRDQAHVHAVVRVIDALDAVGLQFADLFRGDGAAAAAEHADVACAAFLQHVDHVLEVFDMTALVAGQRDGVGVFLQCGADHVLDAAVVAEVDDFGALRLDQPAHDVDGGIVAIEQAGGSDKPQRRGLALCRRCDVVEGGCGWRAHGALRA